MPSPLLQIRDATKVYESGGFLGSSKKSVVALDHFNMTIDESPATITTIAGESGSGKTTLANLVLGFIKLTSGQIIFDGEDITNMTDEQLKLYRRNVQAVFQDPFGVYNPFYRIDHVFHLVNKHFSLSDNQTEYRDMVEAGLNVVGLYGEDVLRKYPHQLSGGQRQRIMMARAYMIKPRLIVADEPVSMVDASLRASILDAMLRLRDDYNISFLYITHDLSTAYQIGDQIYMLYQGTTAERGSAVDVIDAPQHPYVQLLIDSVPVPDPTDKWDVDISLPSEEEMRTATAKGCRYYPRCPHRMDQCLEEQPPLYMMDRQGHEAACYLYEENEVAPIESPVLVNKPITEAAAGAGRIPWLAAAVLVIVAFAVGFLIREPEEIVKEVVVTATAIPATATLEQAATVPPPTAPPAVEVAGVLLGVEGAADKGALTLNVMAEGDIESADESHSYRFEAVAGQAVAIKLGTGGGGLSGSGFYSPFGTVYGPDGAAVVTLGDSDRPRRNYREDVTLEMAGSYQVIIGPFERNGREYGIEFYTLVFEGEAPAVEVPDFALGIEGAADKGALTLNVMAEGDIESAGESHSYSFEATAGQAVAIKLGTGGGGLSGSGFYSPFGYLYAPDGSFVLMLGDSDRPRRNYREDVTLGATGSYQVVIGPFERNGRDYGIEFYTIVFVGTGE